MAEEIKFIVGGKEVPPGQHYVVLNDGQVGVIVCVDVDSDGDLYLRAAFEEGFTETFYSATSKAVKEVVTDRGQKMPLVEYFTSILSFLKVITRGEAK